MELYLINQTRVQAPEGLCYGQLDLEPSESFEEELDQIRVHLDGMDADRCYSSPLSRCKQLARSLYLPTEVKFDDRLIDLHYGSWEGQYWSQLDQRQVNYWLHNFIDTQPPGGESYQHLQGRLMDFWEDLMLEPLHHVMLITHPDVIRLILIHVLNMPLAHMPSIKIDPASVSKIRVLEGRFEVSFINRV